jgi:molybdopterin molybdotransferase
MLELGEALRAVMQQVSPLPAERVALHEAAGRVLAADVRARFDLPRFDNSAMDGYAVRQAELRDGVELAVVGESRASGRLPPALAPGTAMRIFTGAALPEGADSVVIQENAERSGDRVRFTRLAERGDNLRARGSDLAAGTLALGAGSRLDAGAVGLLAGLGEGSVQVHRRPRVALLSTGDELVPLGSSLPVEGALIDSNGPALAVLAAQAGAESWLLPGVGDDPAALAARVEQALQGADVLISTGGVSVGDHDHMRAALSAAGVSERFWKVAVKPGKPVLFGCRGAQRVLGLPGNPISALVTFVLFAQPLLRALQGDRTPYPLRVPVRLAHGLRRRSGRTELLRARLVPDASGLRAELHPLQGSGSLPSMAGADALVVVPAERADLVEGESLSALLLGGPGSAQPPF